MNKTYTLKIYRGNPGKQYWEEFLLPLRDGENVISGLMEIQKNPINKAGERVTPIVWEQGCLEEVCGSCSMLVNGYPRQACTALIENYIRDTGKTTITLAPFTKFPLVRDLIVDRSSMFENLKKAHTWIEVEEGSKGDGFGPLISPAEQEIIYTLSRCMTCGCCMEGCPQVNSRSPFIGPALTTQVDLFNRHPSGKKERDLRLDPFMGEGGIAECGNAQNCTEVCPKHIIVTDSIARIGGATTLLGFRDLFHL